MNSVECRVWIVECEVQTVACSPVVSCHQNPVAKAVAETSNLLLIRLEFQMGQDWPRVVSVFCSCLFYSVY